MRRIVAGSSALFFATALTLTVAPAASAKGPRCPCESDHRWHRPVRHDPGHSQSNRLEGGRGDDTLVGGRDGDFLVGGTGHDLLDGGRGSDDEAAVGGSIGVEVDLTNGTATGEGHDTLAGIEDVAGSQADDTITGDAKANEIEGGAGDDVLSGGDGDDYFLDNSGDDHADGGEGTDIIDFWPGPGVTVDLASGIASTAQTSFTLASIEWVGGSSFDDTLIGDAGPNLLFGWYGNDELIGSDGDDPPRRPG